MKNLLFQAKNMCKFYPGTKALKGVDMDIYEGEVIGLIGENGAGKSTLMKLMMGVEPATEGEMTLMGQPYKPANPREATENGIGMVFQEQSLITNLTVGQNIYLGQEKKYKSFGLVSWSKMYKDAREVLARVGFDHINPAKKVGDLSFATRQMVEIAKVFNAVKESGKEHSLILLDEPTSVLNDEEIQELFKNVRELKKSGDAIIFVSHRLDEVIEISDRIYVFKDGENVGEISKDEAEESVLYEKMVGRTSTGEYYKLNRQRTPEEEVVLEVENLGLMGAFKDVSFKLHKGEILGFCGVVGSGKEDVCSVLIGDEKATRGTIKLNGVEQTLKVPYQALKKGILSIPQERREEGILAGRSIYENISISNLKAVSSGPFISKQKQINLAKKWIDELNIKCSSYAELCSQLSGGNAQKVVFGRLMASGAQVMILNHPTRGVDIGAKEEIYQLIRDIADQGIAVIVLGDTLDESIGLSNRILVMKDGLITAEFDASVGNKPEQVDIVKYMM